MPPGAEPVEEEREVAEYMHKWGLDNLCLAAQRRAQPATLPQEWLLEVLANVAREPRHAPARHGVVADDRAATPASPTSSRARRANAPIVASDVRAQGGLQLVPRETSPKSPRLSQHNFSNAQTTTCPSVPHFHDAQR